MDNHQGNSNVLIKLLRKPSAAFAIGIIVLTTLVATFAYPLSPDDTPYANRMIIELGAKPPGFKTQLLQVPRLNQPRPTGMLQYLAGGRDASYTVVPINHHWFDEGSIYAAHYIDEGIEDTISYPVAMFSEKATARSEADLQSYISQNHINNTTFHLGTDRYGRDILSRLLVGARVSIAVGFIAVLLSITIGIVLGCLAGFFSGITDNLVMWLINILWAIPTLLLVFAITLTIGKGFWQIFIAIGLTMWVSAARLVRGQVLALKEMEYITAAKALGYGNTRIIYRHILPNIAGPVMVIAASNFATAILIEAGLSFLGVGVQPPMPSWGLMIKEHYNFLLTNRPLLAIVPGVVIMLLVYAFNVLGNALRDVLDVRQ